MNQRIKSRKLNTALIIFVLAFVFLFFLCYLFPYTGDDWGWGSEPGIQRLNNHFRDLNGRYLGNLAVIALTRSNLLKTTVMSATLFITSLFSYRIAGEKRWEAFAVYSSQFLLLRASFLDRQLSGPPVLRIMYYLYHFCSHTYTL